jgi:uncharacterized Zn-finger protein
VDDVKDIDCPYCGTDQEINHDDGQGYAEDETHEQECSDCGKTFVFTTRIMFLYEAEKAPCLNGEEHKYKSLPGSCYPDRKVCEYCDKEIRGELVWPK